MFLYTWILSCFIIRNTDLQIHAIPATYTAFKYRPFLGLSLRTSRFIKQFRLQLHYLYELDIIEPYRIHLLEENTGRDEHAAEEDPLEKENTLNKIHQHLISKNLLTKYKKWLNRNPLLLQPESLPEYNIPHIQSVDPGSGALWEKYQRDGDWTVL